MYMSLCRFNAAYTRNILDNRSKIYVFLSDWHNNFERILMPLWHPGPRLLEPGKWNCEVGCLKYGFSCNVNPRLDGTTDIFRRAGVNCYNSSNNINDTVWNRPYHPLFHPSPLDERVGECVGYVDVPGRVECSVPEYYHVHEEPDTTRRLCDCVDPSKPYTPFF